MKTILFCLLASLAACGGDSKAPAKPEPEPVATPVEPAPVTPVAEPTPTSEPIAKEEPPPPDPKIALAAAETAAYENAKPVLEKFCKSCHMKGNRNATAKKLAELDITEYPFKGKHANTKDIREVLGIGGGKPTMPKGAVGSVKGDDLALIAAWADAWDANHK
ncbi:MAG: hypothetical protein H0T89_11260 [Deltaproteobacteria bacterium]|nr:hypothetical protein [Deltaproteobacteria bacterium]